MCEQAQVSLPAQLAAAASASSWFAASPLRCCAGTSAVPPRQRQFLCPPHSSSLPPACSLGTLDSAKGVYESILDLKVATPQIVLNYAALMLEHKFFEEAFRWAGAR